MAERIVDALEVVEVDVEQRAARAAVGESGELLREPVAEQQPVGQLRQRIEMRLAVEVLGARARSRAMPTGAGAQSVP